MNPTVIAAAIGVGGTVIVGLGGFWANVRSTSKTIQAARDTRIWDKRAEVYIDALAAVYYRQTNRDYEMLTYRLDEDTDRQAKAYLAAYPEPDWCELESCLLGFGSHAVVTAMHAGVETHKRAISAFQAWKEAAGKAGADNEARGQGLPVPATPGEASTNIALHAAQVKARKAANAARKAANTADGDVIEIIRVELQGKSDPLDLENASA
jgi:hypothetical protein